MDLKLKRRIANDYPYPITVDFMRLNTMEYKNHGPERLGKIIDVTEVIIQFLALISISDIVENSISGKITVPDTYKARFKNNFSQTSLGKWVELLRETIKVFKSQNQKMFIEELADYFVKGTSSETKVQQAFNKIVSIRNSLNHKDKHYSRNDMIKLSMEADSNLEFILKELEFIIDYQFLYVNKITVKYHRWAEPIYNIDMSYIVGSNPELFDSINNDSNPRGLINTPAVVIIKDSSKEYLNLDPLIIYSDEGEMNITDIFMYIGWEKHRSKIIYKPIWKGGKFSLLNTSLDVSLTPEMLKIMEVLSTKHDYEGFKYEIDKLELFDLV